jgi:trans-2,3-dihydro-3-hydroxyanthranilate isomerase
VSLPEPRIRFALVDVFTHTPLEGHPLAVVPDAERLDESLLPRITRELNQSETTFIFPAKGPAASRRLRSFTADGEEVYGPDRHALGAWWWLAESGCLILRGARTRLCQELGERVLPLIIESVGGRLTAIAMQQGPPIFGLIASNRKSIAQALGLPSAALGPSELPAQVISTGIPHLLVPVAPSALRALRPDRERLPEVLMDVGAEGCYVFGPTPGQRAVARARFFSPAGGAREEPATGTAAGPLACYLRYYDLLKDGLVRIAQGYEAGRPSELEIEIHGDQVLLRGRAVVVGEGTLRLP